MKQREDQEEGKVKVHKLRRLEIQNIRLSKLKFNVMHFALHIATVLAYVCLKNANYNFSHKNWWFSDARVTIEKLN
jgi:hypothetical protein